MAQIRLSDFYTQQGDRLPGDRLLGYRGYRTRIRSAPDAGGGVLVEGITPDTKPSAASPSPPRKVLGAATGEGYQAIRITRALDCLEDEGLKLSDYTRPELRRLVLEVLERKPNPAGIPAPSPQTLDRAIRRRLEK
jgi:hypothetical protein